MNERIIGATRVTCYLRRWLFVAVLFALFVIFSSAMWAQNVFEADAGVGYDSVDMQAWLGISPTNWDQTSIAGDIEAFPFHAGPVALGAEAGYQRFFSYVEPNGYGGYRSATVHAWHLLALARIGTSHGLFAETGLGAQFFPGGTDASLTGSVGYMIDLGKSFSVPIKLRADLVLDSYADQFPLGLSAGLVYRPSK